jgi:lipopolysaccharide export system ATP-binding protein
MSMDGSSTPVTSRILRAEGLVKRYKKRTVVRNVHVDVRQGEVVGLLGPNGAGKTTTFYMIVGMIRPNDGHVYLDDTEITTMAMYKRARMGIGYLPQEASIFRKMSVEENIMSILQMMDLTANERSIRCDRLMADFSITHLARSKGFIRGLSCSMSRLPASIRLPLRKSCASSGR